MNTMVIQSTPVKSLGSFVDKLCPSDKTSKDKMNKYEKAFTELSDEEIKEMQKLMDYDE